MPDTIPNHFRVEFGKNWTERIQQTKSRLNDYIVFDDFDGDRKSFDRIGSMSSQTITDRKGKTRLSDADTDTRWVYRHGEDLAQTLDEFDSKNLGPLALPDGMYIRQHTNAYNRSLDDEAWKSALNPVKTGTTGTTELALPASQKIAAGGTGLTLAKLIQAREILNAADMGEDDAPTVLVVTAKQLTDLFNTTEVKSSDYNTVKALAQGEVDSFMGFTFKICQRLPKAGTTRSLVGWVKGTIIVIRGMKKVHVDEIPEQQHTIQIRSVWTLGGTRLHDEAVVQIDVTEA